MLCRVSCLDNCSNFLLHYVEDEILKRDDFFKRKEVSVNVSETDKFKDL